jgi:hypothetical protein
MLSSRTGLPILRIGDFPSEPLSFQGRSIPLREMVCFLLLTAAGSIHAQTVKQPAAKDTIQRDVLLEKDYKPQIGPAEKVTLYPELEPVQETQRPYEFSLSGQPAPIKGIYLPLPAPGIAPSFPALERMGYFKVGGGSHQSFLGDIQVNLLKQVNQRLDVRLLHQSVFGDITNSMQQTTRSFMNKNRLLASYALFLPQQELTASLSERYNTWNYYGGWKTPTTIPYVNYAFAAPSSQWLSDSEWQVDIKSKMDDSPLSYAAGIDGHLFRLGRSITNIVNQRRQVGGGKENELNLHGRITYRINDGTQLGLKANIQQLSYKQPQPPVLDSLYYFSNPSSVIVFENQSWTQLTPYIQFPYHHWTWEAGLNMAVPSLESETVKWNPIVSGETLLNEKTALQVSLGGGIIPYTYREGFEMNPYLNPIVHLNLSHQLYQLSGRIDYRPVAYLRLSPYVSYDYTKNQPFFYNALPDSNAVINHAYGSLFDVSYFSCYCFTIGADAHLNLQNRFLFTVDLKYRHYATHSDDPSWDKQLINSGRKAWYQPGLQARIHLEASPLEKLTLTLDHQTLAWRYAPTPSNFMHRLNDIHDLCLGISGDVSRNVQLFLQLNNLLDQRYETWYGYQVHGFTALIGGNVSF